MLRAATARWENKQHLGGWKKKRTKDICVKLQQMLSPPQRRLFVLWVGWGERKRARAHQRARNAFSLFPSSPARFLFFRLLLFLWGYPAQREPLLRRQQQMNEGLSGTALFVVGYTVILCVITQRFSLVWVHDINWVDEEYCDHRKGIEKSPCGHQYTLTNSFAETKFKTMLFFYFCFWLFKAWLIKFTDWMLSFCDE